MTQPTQTFKASLWADDEDDEENPPAVMIRDVVLTRYDKVLQKLRTAEAKRDAWLALPSLTDLQRLQLRHCEQEVVKAQAAFSKETARGKTDEGRKQDRLDAYRKTPEGREIYNTSRRKKRATANADLSGLTPEEKAAHKREQTRARLVKFRAKPKPSEEAAADVQRDAYTNEELTLALGDLLEAPAPIAAITPDFAAHEATIQRLTNLARKSRLAGPLELSEPFLSNYRVAQAALGRLD